MNTENTSYYRIGGPVRRQVLTSKHSLANDFVTIVGSVPSLLFIPASFAVHSTLIAGSKVQSAELFRSNDHLTSARSHPLFCLFLLCKVTIIMLIAHFPGNYRLLYNSMCGADDMTFCLNCIQLRCLNVFD
ncbi:hypothetical protein CEXT_86591 [Caerostris extrusa]|uniref:Uncharacterized protein n=1 Tax=Caerostris extrusa TaxID=172846 RepID=A0AAV4N5M2_CAEEX|nr:hypothetical protein CEXT_86591 [Caerostris extrusa]